MDCAECALHVQQAIEKVPGVASANVLLGAEKAIVQLDADLVDMPILRRGRRRRRLPVPEKCAAGRLSLADFTRRGADLLCPALRRGALYRRRRRVVGLFENLTARVPFWLGRAARPGHRLAGLRQRGPGDRCGAR